MAEVGVVLKVPQSTHARFKEACAKHDRSMQKVLLSLIEGWVASGAQDPGTYGRISDPPHQNQVEDLKARQAIVELAAALKKLQDRLAELKQAGQSAPIDRHDFEALYASMRQSASEEAPQVQDL